MSELFRAEAVRRLRDPQQLDAALRLTSASSWLALLTLGLVLAAVVAWGFLGTIPFRASGLGVTLRQGSTIYALESPVSARVKSVDVIVGQVVRQGDRLTELHLPEVEARRESARERLEALQNQLDRQTQFIDRDIQTRRENTEKQINAQRAKMGALRERLVYLEDLERTEQDELNKGYITRKELEDTRTEIYQVRQDLREATIQISTLRAEQTEHENERQQELVNLAERVLEAEGELDEVTANIGADRVLYSPVDGVVTEIAARVGVLVNPGEEMVTVEETGRALLVYAYLPVAKGKKVAKGMRAQVSPTSVERDIYGSIIGTVTEVSELPITETALSEKLGDPQLAQEMLAGGAPIEITIELKRDPSTPSGLAWSSSTGPPTTVTPGSTAYVAVIVNEIRPVDLVVPLYETWIGGSRL